MTSYTDEESRAAKAMADARTLLILGRDPANLKQPSKETGMTAFFAVLAMRLEMVPDHTVATLATDGRLLKYNPKFILRLTPEERVACVCHEVKHLALKHHARRERREIRRWNLACDLAINHGLRASGFRLPRNTCVPGEGPFAGLPVGKSAEWYYSNMDPDAADQGQDDGPGETQGKGEGEAGAGGGGPPRPGGNDPGGNGGVCDPGDGSQAAQSEAAAEWEVAVAQAARVARQRGRLPSFLDRLVHEALHPRVDWKEVLREFVTRHARNDYRWMPPSRRYIHMGLYLPGMRSEELGDLVVAVDTSGSISQPILQKFAAEITAIVEAFSATATIVYCDAAIQGVQRYSHDDGPLRLAAKGGGGTSHLPVFEWLAAHGGDTPCVVCLTDLYTEFPSQAPGVPVLWCVYGNTDPIAPFGQVVVVE